jgi:hypothetical protein
MHFAKLFECAVCDNASASPLACRSNASMKRDRLPARAGRAAASAAGRTPRAVFGIGLVAAAFGLAGLSGVGFDATFAKQSVACGAPVAEAWPEDRPSGPSRDEAEYLWRTGSLAEGRAEYNAEAVNYFEAKACGTEARSRLWKLGIGAGASWTAGGLVLRSALRRKPRNYRRELAAIRG